MSTKDLTECLTCVYGRLRKDSTIECLFSDVVLAYKTFEHCPSYIGESEGARVLTDWFDTVKKPMKNQMCPYADSCNGEQVCIDLGLTNSCCTDKLRR